MRTLLLILLLTFCLTEKMKLLPAPNTTADSDLRIRRVAPKPPAKPQPVECVASGCSGEMCVAKGTVMTMMCIRFDEKLHYCHSLAKCEAQQGGKTCGWTQTKDSLACLRKPEHA
jgi:hypothetical protein